jgi:hypothetical protein
MSGGAGRGRGGGGGTWVASGRRAEGWPTTDVRNNEGNKK